MFPLKMVVFHSYVSGFSPWHVHGFFEPLPCQEGYLWPAKSSEPRWLHGTSALGLGRLHDAPGRAAAKPLTGAGRAKKNHGSTLW